MVITQRRVPVPGPAFLRQLARLTDGEVTADGRPLSERLSQWINWNRAVSLSRALDGRLPAPAEEVHSFADDDADACAQARASLIDSITRFRIPVAAPSGATVGGENDTSAAIDYAIVQKHCVGVQRAMQTATGRLRGRLRDRLSQGSPALARLAEVDAEMEAILSPREYALLAMVPKLLEQHFRSMAETHTSPSSAWLDVFRRDVQDILLAELDVRFQPIDGLLAALRTS